MSELFKLIDRFQSLRAKTGVSKLSSYQLTINFDPDGAIVELQWGCYDIADLSAPRGNWSEIAGLKVD